MIIMNNIFILFIKKYKWIFISVVALVLIVVLVTTIKALTKPKIGPAQNSSNQGPAIPATFPSVDAKYITAVPLDLTQIQSVSKFRSCAGHDFSGYNFEKTLETDRNMKHYIYPISKYQGTLDKVKILAPFDGTVSAITLEKDEIGKPGKRPKTGNSITFSTPVDTVVRFEFGHLYFAKDFKVGDSVKAGDLVGYASLGEKGNDFDIDLFAWIKKDGTEIRAFGSAFDHMSDSVLAEFAKYGLTPINTKFTKVERDAKPCDYANTKNTQGRTGEDWAKLTPPKTEQKTVSKTTSPTPSSSDSTPDSSSSPSSNSSDTPASVPVDSTPSTPVAEDTPSPTLYLPYSTSSNTPTAMTPMGETIYHPKPQHPSGHPGIDFQWENPSEVPTITASMDATVTAVTDNSSHAGTSDVQTKNGKWGVDYTEMSGVREGLKVGDTVKVGDAIGTPQHPSSITDQPNFRMIHWQFGYIRDERFGTGVGDRLCPLSYFASSAKSTIESLWANTNAPELKANSPNICSGDYAT